MIRLQYTFLCDRCDGAFFTEFSQRGFGGQFIAPSTQHTVYAMELCTPCREIVAGAVAGSMQRFPV